MLTHAYSVSLSQEHSDSLNLHAPARVSHMLHTEGTFHSPMTDHASMPNNRFCARIMTGDSMAVAVGL